MFRSIEEILDDSVKTVGIAGHVNPDGDCVGSCTALMFYFVRNYPELTVDLYLEKVNEGLVSVKGLAYARREAEAGLVYDLFILCDVSSPDRIGVAEELFKNARRTAVIDHHTNTPVFSDLRHVEPEASSCAEVLAGLFDLTKIDEVIAENLYTGIIHDTGVFQYSCTGPRTLETAAKLTAFGIPFSRIIDETFNERTLTENRILGYTLQKMESRLDGKLMLSFLNREEMKAYGADPKDLSLIVSQMRLTKGCELAAFVYEKEPGMFKVSFRSRQYVDAAALARRFGGGGHIRASGCSMEGSEEEIREVIIKAAGEVL